MSDTEEQKAISLKHIEQEHRLRTKRRYGVPIVIISLIIVLIIAYVVYDTWAVGYL